MFIKPIQYQKKKNKKTKQEQNKKIIKKLTQNIRTLALKLL